MEPVNLYQIIGELYVQALNNQRSIMALTEKVSELTPKTTPPPFPIPEPVEQ